MLDNLIDPMHGTYLHKQWHSMAEGDATAKFHIRDTDHGLAFEKAGQRDVNFDWTEWADTGSQLPRQQFGRQHAGVGPVDMRVAAGS